MLHFQHRMRIHYQMRGRGIFDTDISHLQCSFSYSLDFTSLSLLSLISMFPGSLSRVFPLIPIFGFFLDSCPFPITLPCSSIRRITGTTHVCITSFSSVHLNIWNQISILFLATFQQLVKLCNKNTLEKLFHSRRIELRLPKCTSRKSRNHRSLCFNSIWEPLSIFVYFFRKSFWAHNSYNFPGISSFLCAFIESDWILRCTFLSLPMNFRSLSSPENHSGIISSCLSTYSGR